MKKTILIVVVFLISFFQISGSFADVYSTRVAGVTFENEDGTKRQALLEAAYEVGGNFSKHSGTLQEYTFEGSDAIYVLLNGEVIGNIPENEVKIISPYVREIDEVIITISRFLSEENEYIYYASISSELPGYADGDMNEFLFENLELVISVTVIVIIVLVVVVCFLREKKKKKGNFNRLLKICSSLIERYESTNTIISCKDDLFSSIKKQLLLAKDEIETWDDCDTDYIKIAHSLLANHAFDLLASGKYHVRTNVLSPLMCGNAIWHNNIGKQFNLFF